MLRTAKAPRRQENRLLAKPHDSLCWIVLTTSTTHQNHNQSLLGVLAPWRFNQNLVSWRFNHYLASSFFSRSLSCAGLALPPIAFIT